MNKCLNVFLNRKNSIRILVCVVFSAISQPLIAWGISHLSDIFTHHQLSYFLLGKYIFILLWAIFIAWIASNIKSNLLLDGELALRKQVFSGIYAMPIGNFEEMDSGSYYNQIGRDVQLLSSNVFESVIRIMIDIVNIVFISILLMTCHWLSFIIIALFLLPLTINNVLMPKTIGKLQERSMHMFVGMTIKVKDVLSGFSSAKFQEGEDYIKGSTYEYFENTTAAEKRIAKLSNLSALIANSSVTLSQISGFIIAFLLMKNRMIDFSQFILVFQLGMILNVPVVDMINAIISIKSFESYVLNTEKIISIKENKAVYKLDRINSVSFKNVSFCYPEKERYVLNQFNHHFERGKKYLIIGESGSGKTTLAKLFLGILHPSTGSIIYGSGINQQDLLPEEIYHHSAIVPQDIYIFDDSIRRNLDLQGSCSEQKLKKIIEKVKLEKFFATNHYTLETRITNETLKVSGGEKARIGIARALTMNKSVVIYDEVLSGLDPENAEIIEDLILNDNDRIVIHIAHKSSSKYIDRYDEVIRLKM